MTRLLTADEIADLKQEIDPDWQISTDGKSISRRFKFCSYLDGVAFANRIAEVADKQGHHPDLHINYTNCRVVYSTHSVGGLTRLDFNAARTIDQLCQN
jgi:4a-hydroxytetrahydrobiopterin dehydratase